MWLVEFCSTNPLRIPHPKSDKLACRGLGVGIFAKGEISLRKYDATLVASAVRRNNPLFCSPILPHKKRNVKGFQKENPLFRRSQLDNLLLICYNILNNYLD